VIAGERGVDTLHWVSSPLVSGYPWTPTATGTVLYLCKSCLLQYVWTCCCWYCVFVLYFVRFFTACFWRNKDAYTSTA